MGSKFPSNCFVSLPLPAHEYYRLYFALDGNSIFRDMVCEARSSAEKESSVYYWGTEGVQSAWLVIPGLTCSPCPVQVQDRAVQSSEQWQEGSLLFERLLTLPNYEKCARLLLQRIVWGLTP